LIHLIKIKSRHGNVGNIWLRNNLNNGTIESYPTDENGALLLNEADNFAQKENEDEDLTIITDNT
jgi:hypothetical protein